MQILFGLNLPFSFFAFYANFLFFNCVIHYFGLRVLWINSISGFCWLPSFDLCGHYSPMFVERGQKAYASLTTSHHYF